MARTGTFKGMCRWAGSKRQDEVFRVGVVARNLELSPGRAVIGTRAKRLRAVTL